MKIELSVPCLISMPAGMLGMISSARRCLTSSTMATVLAPVTLTMPMPTTDLPSRRARRR
jgi:hypothetical protein